VTDAQRSIFEASPLAPATATASRRVAILLTGPNCSGKTTAVERAAEGWPEGALRVVHADKELKGSPAEQEAALAAAWAGPEAALLVEGINRGASAFAEVSARCREAREVVAVHVTRSSPAIMREHLIARCAKRGKRFRADYWTHRVLLYEGTRRYAELARRRFPGARFWDVAADYSHLDALVETLRAQIREALPS